MGEIMGQFERRKTYRVEVENIWAQCFSDGSAGRYHVENLSHGGLLVAGKPNLPEETSLSVFLNLPGDEPLAVDGIVRRHERRPTREPRFAIEFGYLNDDEQDTLDDFIVAKVVRSLSPTVVIGSASAWERKALARSVQELGYGTVSMATPLSVIRFLGSKKDNVAAVILGAQLGRISALEFARYLQEAHPTIRRVLVTRSNGRRRQAAERLVHAVVRKPWTEESLEASLCINN
jgi:hypothetical protein